MNSQRKAREALLKALYLSESRNMTADEAFGEMSAIDREIAAKAGEPEAEAMKPFALCLSDAKKEYALSLAHRIENNHEKLNALIKPVLKNWDFSRVSRIDRIILWIAVAEMLYMLDIPPSVSINEAIELAKKFSTHKSPAFINGILDSIARNTGIIDNKREASNPLS
ncbi:MAG: transcription antitermination factor NusB [Candidatus Latescibacterota bacterium]